MLAPPPTYAEEFCVGLNKALRSAETHFSSIRAKFDFNTHSYGSKVTLGRLSTCEITGDESQAEFECLEEFGGDAAGARAVFTKLTSDLEACLSGKLVSGNMSSDTRRYRDASTDDDIELRVRRLPRSGIYEVLLSITFIDLSR
jgi:hypothetical protein